MHRYPTARNTNRRILQRSPSSVNYAGYVSDRNGPFRDICGQHIRMTAILQLEDRTAKVSPRRADFGGKKVIVLQVISSRVGEKGDGN